jgi:3-dehydroquinate dehydratase-2
LTFTNIRFYLNFCNLAANCYQFNKILTFSGQSEKITANSPNFFSQGRLKYKLVKYPPNSRYFCAGSPSMATILVLHGPNLNLLGLREPEIYGATTLADINTKLIADAEILGHSLSALQSNAEFELINRIHSARTDGTDFIIINPAAFTHTSVAIRDALLGVAIPFIEVHLSNVHKREAFRHHSYFSDIAQGVICGFGATSYDLALQAANQSLTSI